MRNDFDDDVTRYHKKSKRKPPAKSKHKHEFKPCVFEYEDIIFDNAHGFINKPEHSIWTSIAPVKPNSTAVCVVDTEEARAELDPATRTLPTFFLKDRWFQKYVDLNGGG